MVQSTNQAISLVKSSFQHTEQYSLVFTLNFTHIITIEHI